MPITAEDLKWYHYIFGAAVALFGAIFGAGMASQRFINGFQTRLLTTERHREHDRADIDKLANKVEKFMTVEDFRREQNTCQIHMMTLMGDIKIANEHIQKSLDELTRILIQKER